MKDPIRVVKFSFPASVFAEFYFSAVCEIMAGIIWGKVAEGFLEGAKLALQQINGEKTGKIIYTLK